MDHLFKTCNLTRTIWSIIDIQCPFPISSYFSFVNLLKNICGITRTDTTFFCLTLREEYYHYLDHHFGSTRIILSWEIIILKKLLLGVPPTPHRLVDASGKEATKTTLSSYVYRDMEGKMITMGICYWELSYSRISD